MKKAKLLLLTLLALIGYSGAQAGETVNNYAVDFNQEIRTSDHQFAVSKDWKHIAEYYDDDGDFRYMSYSYSSTAGIEESGALNVYRQYASGSGYGSSGKVVYDMLVTPKVSGKVTIQVKNNNASSSYPSFIQFYQVNDNGTEYGEEITAQIVDADQQPAEINKDNYVTAQIELSTATRIGIRAQYVYLDNFTAESAVIEKERKLAITSAVPTATSGTIYWDQQANGNVLVKYMVKVQNVGEVPFAPEDDGYSVSIFNRKTNDVYVTTLISQALDPQATSDEFEVSVELDPTTWPNTYTYINMDLKENVSGSVVQRAQSNYNRYEPKFVFREGGSTSTSNLYGDIAFGMVTEEVSKTYEIYNDGIAPLQVKSITVPDGYTANLSGEFTVDSKAFKSFTITLPATTQGVFSGDLVVVYVDKNGDEATYSKAVTGNVLDPSKNLITFDDGAGNNAYPAGSVRGHVYISTEGSGAAKNSYLQVGTGSNPLFITPLMTATAGEKITFDAENTAYSGSIVEVMISKDRQNWTPIQTISEISSSSKWTTYTAEIPEAGDWFLGFKLTKAKIDNIYGLVYAEGFAHNLLIVKSDIPAKGTQNAEYTATVSVGNIGPNVETAGNYTATLYVDGEAVATNNDVELPVANINGNYNNFEENNYTTLSFTFKPHTIGTLPAYIEVKSGDAVVKTEKVDVTIDEEKVESDIAVLGSNPSTSNTNLLHMNWNNSESVSLYTKEVLEAAGLQAGDVIESITFKGYRSADPYTTTLSVWYEKTTDVEQPAPANGIYDTKGMTQAITEEHQWKKEGSSTELADLIVINLAEPITYDGKSSLRFVVRSEANSFKQAYFEVTNILGNSYYHRQDNADNFKKDAWSANYYLPAIHFGLKVEPKIFEGTVSDMEYYAPIEGATVMLRNEAEDVEYTGTTDASGAFKINVIQDDLTYTLSITADGYEPMENGGPLTFEENYADFLFYLRALPKPTITHNISESQYATLFYETKSLEIPEGVTAYTVARDGNKINLTEVEDVIPAGTAVVINGEAGEYEFNVSDEIQTATLDFTTNEWQLPEGSKNKKVDAADFSNGEYTITLAGSTGQGYYWNNTQYYLMLGKKGATLTLPAFDFEVAKIVVFGKGSASPSVEQNIYVGDAEVSEKTVGATGVNEYLIDENYQAKNTIYTLKVSSAHNTQISKIVVIAKSDIEALESDLIGSDYATTVSSETDNFYVLSWKDENKNPEQLGFYFMTDDGHSATIGAHQAYLKYPASESNGAGFTLLFDADGINTIERAAISENDAIYTISGVRVNATNLQRGLYIVNGKKIVIK